MTKGSEKKNVQLSPSLSCRVPEVLGVLPPPHTRDWFSFSQQNGSTHTAAPWAGSDAGSPSLSFALPLLASGGPIQARDTLPDCRKFPLTL